MSQPMLGTDADKLDAFDSIAAGLKDEKTQEQPDSSLKNDNEEEHESEAPAPEKAPAKEEVVLSKEVEQEIDKKTAADFLGDEPEEESETEKLKRRIAELEALKKSEDEDDEDVIFAKNIAKEAKKQGKSVLQLMKDIAGEDVSKLSPRELYARDLAQYSELSQDEVQEELDRFDGMSKVEQLRATKGIKEQLEKSQKDLLKQLEVNRTTEQEAAKAASEKFQAVVAQNAQTAYKELNSILSEGQYKNFELTPERKAAIKKHLDENLKHDNNGKFDVIKGVKAAILDLYEDEFISANKIKAKNEAREQLFNEVTRASKESSGEKNPDSRTEADKFKAAQSQFWEQQSNKYNLTAN